MRKFIVIIILSVIVAAGIYIYVKYLNVYGEGVKSGQLNYLVRKGDIFKTFEGKLIQSGIRSRQPGSIASYEFEFSVEKKNVAEKLMANSGQEFDLHYKEYRGTLPWRGYTVFIVDSIIAMRQVK